MRLNGGIIACVSECVWFLAVVGSVAYPGHHVCVASEYVLGPRVLQILARSKTVSTETVEQSTCSLQ